MKYLILVLIPTLTLANYKADVDSPTYAAKQMCEKLEGKPCFKLPVEVALTRAAALKEVEVDDFERPILEETAPDIIEVDPVEEECVDGSKPKKDKDDKDKDDKSELVCEKILCEAPTELDEEKGKCVKVTGYQKKLEKQFVVDAEKKQIVEQERQKKQARESTCEQFKVLLKDSAIDAQSNPADQKEVLRRVLGYIKTCIEL